MDKPHQGVLPHTHHGYNHRENDGPKGYGNLTNKERAIVDRVRRTWEEKKLLYGPDGKIVSKMSWTQFEGYQRWDEFPERKDDPPMTVDFVFWYKDKKYYCTGEDYGNVIVDEFWKRMAYDKNFLNLLECPIFDGKSFRDCIDEILFID